MFLKNKGHNQGGVYAHFKVLRSFLYWYQEENDFVNWSNPITKVKVKSPADMPLEPADIDAIKKMLKMCGSDLTGIRDRSMMLFLLDTGIRASELLAIDLENINPITGVVHILNGKGGKFRTVYLSKKSRLAIRKYIKEWEINLGALFISKEGYRLTYSGLRMMLRRRSSKADVPYQSPHSFRRLFAITMLRNGADIFTLQILMGHSDLQVLRRYLKQVQTDFQAAHLIANPVKNLGL